MSQWGLVVVVTITGAIAVVRDLIALWRERARREAVLRLVKHAGHGGRIIDGGAGGPVQVYVGEAGDSPTDAVGYDRGRPAR